MNTQNMEQALPQQEQQKIKVEHAQATVRAFFIDTFLWAYTLLVLHKIVYEKMIMNFRYPEFSWMQPAYALGAGLALSVAFFFTRLSVGKAMNGLYSVREDRTLFKEPFLQLGLFQLLLTFVAGIHISQVSMTEFLSSSGLSGARRIFTALFNPNWNIFEDALFAAIETIYMAFIATTLAIPAAFLLGFFAARNLMSSSSVLFALYSLTRFFLNLTRSIEPLVWAIIFSVWVGIGPFSGMLALFLHSVASLAKLYSEQIENIDNGPIEAITATGAHPIQVIWFGVVPQIVLPYLSFTIYRWDINVRMATVIGLVGGGGIGTMLMQYQGLAKWNEVGMLVIVIATIVWIMDYASSKIRAALK
jgi:phosphonate transport system permease protein